MSQDRAEDRAEIQTSEEMHLSSLGTAATPARNGALGRSTLPTFWQITRGLQAPAWWLSSHSSERRQSVRSYRISSFAPQLSEHVDPTCPLCVRACFLFTGKRVPLGAGRPECFRLCSFSSAIYLSFSSTRRPKNPVSCYHLNI